jgi:hypothetical protein
MTCAIPFVKFLLYVDLQSGFSVQESFDDMMSDWATQPTPFPPGFEDPNYSMDFLDAGSNPLDPYHIATQSANNQVEVNMAMSNYNIDSFNYPVTEATGKEMDFQRFLEQVLPAPDSRLASKELSRIIPTTNDELPPNPPPGPPGSPPLRYVLAASTSSSGSSCIRDLADLSIKLLDHAETVPSETIHEPLTKGGPSPFEVLMAEGGANLGFDVEIIRRRKDVEQASNYALDTTYTLSQNLLDMYPRFIDSFVGKSADAGAMTNAPSSSLVTSVTRRILDPSAIHLILSCHHRLIDIYESLFVHFRVCANMEAGRKIVHHNPGLPCVVTTTIGSFKPPNSVAIAMQFFLIVQFAGSLADKAYELVRGVESMPNTSSHENEENTQSGSNTPINATLLACKAVWNRAKAMSNTIASLKNTLSPRGGGQS